MVAIAITIRAVLIVQGLRTLRSENGAGRCGSWGLAQFSTPVAIKPLLLTLLQIILNTQLTFGVLAVEVVQLFFENLIILFIGIREEWLDLLKV